MNLQWLEHKYASLLGSKLSLFKVTRERKYQFRCPFCGDSEKDKFKARGYIFPSEKHACLMYKCFNCGVSTNFSSFLKRIDPQEYNRFKLEAMRERSIEQPYVPDMSKFNKPRFSCFEPLTKLRTISSLPPNHKAKLYVQQRQIPSRYHFKLYYCPKFYQWVNSVIPEKFGESALKNDHPRLIIPFVDQNGYCFGFQGRSFSKSGLRYITIMLDESKPKVFGLDTVNFKKTIKIVEGPIDSMFLDNAIAVAGGDISLDLFDRDKVILIPDNERRNAQIVKSLEKSLEEGYSVCLWPETIQYKDINDMVVKGGYTSEQIESIIAENTVRGMSGLLKLKFWKKV